MDNESNVEFNLLLQKIIVLSKRDVYQFRRNINQLIFLHN